MGLPQQLGPVPLRPSGPCGSAANANPGSGEEVVPGGDAGFWGFLGCGMAFRWPDLIEHFSGRS